LIALPFMMVLPLTAGLLSLVARSSKRALFAVLAAVGCSMGASSLFILRETWGGEVLTHSIGNWPVGLGLGLASDAMGSIVMLIVLSIGLLSLVFSIGEAEGKDLSKLHSAPQSTNTRTLYAVTVPFWSSQAVTDPSVEL